MNSLYWRHAGIMICLLIFTILMSAFGPLALAILSCAAQFWLCVHMLRGTFRGDYID